MNSISDKINISVLEGEQSNYDISFKLLVVGDAGNYFAH